MSNMNSMSHSQGLDIPQQSSHCALGFWISQEAHVPAGRSDWQMGVSCPITRESLITAIHWEVHHWSSTVEQQVTGFYLTEELDQNVFVLKLGIFNIYPFYKRFTLLPC